MRKRQRRLSGVDEVVLSLYAKGLTIAEIQRALRRDLRGVGVEGDDRPDHREGDPGDERVGGAAIGRVAVPSDRRESWSGLLACPSLHQFGRCAVAEAGSGSVVEFGGDLVELVGGP